MWPQITYLALIFIGAGSGMSKGSISTGVVGPALVLWLLYEGGFFTPLGWAP